MRKYNFKFYEGTEGDYAVFLFTPGTETCVNIIGEPTTFNILDNNSAAHALAIDEWQEIVDALYRIIDESIIGRYTYYDSDNTPQNVYDAFLNGGIPALKDAKLIATPETVYWDNIRDIENAEEVFQLEKGDKPIRPQARYTVRFTVGDEILTDFYANLEDARKHVGDFLTTYLNPDHTILVKPNTSAEVSLADSEGDIDRYEINVPSLQLCTIPLLQDAQNNPRFQTQADMDLLSRLVCGKAGRGLEVERDEYKRLVVKPKYWQATAPVNRQRYGSLTDLLSMPCGLADRLRAYCELRGLI